MEIRNIVREVVYKSFGSIVSAALGAIFGYWIGYIQITQEWDRNIVFLVLMFGVGAPMFAVIAPKENRMWGAITGRQRPTHPLKMVDYDYGFPPCLFFFLVSIIGLPYLFTEVVAFD
jgi:hypothetical protein